MSAQEVLRFRTRFPCEEDPWFSVKTTCFNETSCCNKNSLDHHHCCTWLHLFNPYTLTRPKVRNVLSLLIFFYDHRVVQRQVQPPPLRRTSWRVTMQDDDGRWARRQKREREREREERERERERERENIPRAHKNTLFDKIELETQEKNSHPTPKRILKFQFIVITVFRLFLKLFIDSLTKLE